MVGVWTAARTRVIGAREFAHVIDTRAHAAEIRKEKRAIARRALLSDALIIALNDAATRGRVTMRDRGVRERLDDRIHVRDASHRELVSDSVVIQARPADQDRGAQLFELTQLLQDW